MTAIFSVYNFFFFIRCLHIPVVGFEVTIIVVCRESDRNWGGGKEKEREGENEKE